MMSRILLGALCAVCIARASHAAVVKTVETDIAPAGAAPGDPYNPTFPSGGPSSSDLLEGKAPLLGIGDFTRETSAGAVALTNGTVATFYGTQAADSDHSAYLTAGNSEFVTYSLGGPHVLTSVVIYGGWNDAGRDAQHYELQTSTDGSIYTTLDSIDINPGIQGTHTTPVSNRVAFTSDAGDLATGVTHLRVNFLAVENGYTGYTEIDVFGRLVPEPTGGAVAALGALGLVAARRRR